MPLPPLSEPVSNSNGQKARKSAASPYFLYVEDDVFSREVVKRLIVSVLGYPDLVIFEDSRDFMTRVRALPRVPDVVFLDVQVGPLGGHEMLHLLRDDAAYDDTKIIALTASVMAPEVAALQNAGFDGLIGKPIMKRVFPQLLESILSGEDVWYVS